MTNDEIARRNFPSNSLEDSLRIALAIQDKNGGNPMKRLLLADALGIKPMSTNFRDLLSSSYKYGLTEGTEKADSISLTELGIKISAPRSTQEKTRALQEATLRPDLFRKVFEAYKDKKFPIGDTFFSNKLKLDFQVHPRYVDELVSLLQTNGRISGLIREIGGSPYVMFGDVQTPMLAENPKQNVQDIPPAVAGAADSIRKQDDKKEEKTKPIFIAHGKDPAAVEQLKKILEKFKIPYVIATEEPHAGRVIPDKVRQLMKQCGAGIFLFTSKDENKGENGTVSPNPNMVFELGMADALYDGKIILCKEKGVEFPSNFSSIGHITFESGNLEAKTLDLFQEMVALNLLRIST